MNNSIVNHTDIMELTSRHSLFAGIHQQYGPPPGWYREPGFVSLSKIILEQQVSLASADAHFRKLNGYIKAFTPLHILKLTDDEMRSCQVSRQKAKYLRALSEAILNKEIDLQELSNLSEPEIRIQLTSIKGIGHWTTDIYLMFCLQAKDIFPAGDIAVINTIKALTPAKTKEEMLSLSEEWKPLRSLATYFLWHHYLCRRNKKAGNTGIEN